jgi:hypothetical protein
MPIPPAPTGGDAVSTPSFVSTINSQDLGDQPRTNAGTLATVGSFETVSQPTVVQFHINPFASNYVTSARISASATIQDAPVILIIDATAGNVTITLPSPRIVAGKTITVMRYDNTAARTITINTTEGNVRTTASVSSILGTQYGAIDLTASVFPDAAGTGEEMAWIGR